MRRGKTYEGVRRERKSASSEGDIVEASLGTGGDGRAESKAEGRGEET